MNPSLDEEVAQLLRRALHLLSLRPRSEYELRQKFSHPARGRIYSSEAVNLIIERLKTMNLIDDRAFAEWLVESRKKRHVRGKILIERELESHHIKREIIEEILAKCSPLEERLLILGILDKKAKKYRHLATKEQKMKLLYLLARKGFSPSNTSKIIDDFLQVAYNDIIQGE